MAIQNITACNGWYYVEDKQHAAHEIKIYKVVAWAIEDGEPIGIIVDWRGCLTRGYERTGSYIPENELTSEQKEKAVACGRFIP